MTDPRNAPPESSTERPPQGRPETAPRSRDARRRGRWRRAARWAGAIVALAIAVAGGVQLFVIGRQMPVPDWLEARIEARIEALLPEIGVELGAVSFRLEPSLDVSVGVAGVAVLGPGGDRLFDLVQLDATLARRGLLRAALEAKAISASGLFLSLERGPQGRFDFGMGEMRARSAPDFRSLLAALDAAMEHPRLAGLRRVSLGAVTLDYRDRMAGRAWLIDGGRVDAERQGDDIVLRGDLALLTGGAGVASLAVTAESPVGSRAWSLGVTLGDMPSQDIASQSRALSWLGVLRAPISGALRTELDADGTFAPLAATLQIGAGVLQPSETTRPIPFEAARTYFTFDPDAARLEFTELSLTSDWLTATGTGIALLEAREPDGDPTGALIGAPPGAPMGTPTGDRSALTGLEGRIVLERLSGNPGALFSDGPRSLGDVRADLHLDLAPFRLRIGEIAARAGALDLRGQAEVRAAPEGWAFSALLEAPSATAGAALHYWPRDRAPGVRDWIARNVIAGRLDDLQAVLRARAGAAPEVYLGAAISEARIQALETLPPLEVAAGRMTLEAGEFVVIADRASVDPGRGGPIDASGTRFRIPETRPGQGADGGIAEISVRSNATLEATLALLDHPPFEVLRRIGRPADLAEGRAAMVTEIRLPLDPGARPAGLDWRAAGQVRGLRSTRIVPGRDLQADRIAVSADPETLRLTGAGTLSGAPFDAVFEAPVGGRGGEGAPARAPRLAAEVMLSDAALRAFGIDLPPGTVAGAAPAALRIEAPAGAPPVFSLSSDLRGLGLSVPALGWALPEADEGRLSVAGALGAPPRIDSLALSGAGLEASGRPVLSADGALARLELDRLRVGGWLDTALTLTPRGPGARPALALGGGRIDLRAAPFGAAGGGASAAPPAPLDVGGLRLQVTDTLALDALNGSFELGAALDGRFSARVNGGAAITGEVAPRSRGQAIDIRSDTAGSALRDAALFPDMTGGRMHLKLRPTGTPGTFDGDLSIDQLRIRNAPAMAALLNAISIVGLPDELGGQGIYFEEIDALFRLGEGRLVVTESSAVGPSMGVSLDGVFDLAARELSFRGVVSPFYAVNILGRIIARRGEGLIGLSFTMDGPAAAPQVSVNPLSALTPGMFRDIFRRPPPSLDE